MALRGGGVSVIHGMPHHAMSRGCFFGLAIHFSRSSPSGQSGKCWDVSSLTRQRGRLLGREYEFPFDRAAAAMALRGGGVCWTSWQSDKFCEGFCRQFLRGGSFLRHFPGKSE